MKKAFTLVELLIVIALLSVISAVFASVIINYTTFYQKQQAAIAASLANRTTLDEIAANIREAVGIGSDLTLDGTIFTTSQSVLILLLPGLDANGQFLPGVTDSVIFYQDPADNQLLKKQVVPAPSSTRPAISQILTANLKSIDFQYNDPNPQQASMVTVNLETTHTIGSRTQNVTGTLQSKLRNL